MGSPDGAQRNIEQAADQEGEGTRATTGGRVVPCSLTIIIRLAKQG
jgi:hypothetical protein